VLGEITALYCITPLPRLLSNDIMAVFLAKEASGWSNLFILSLIPSELHLHSGAGHI
jgi:hypothetical protein